jgi:hypothetical protein
MTELVIELDSAIYGSETMDFEAWKRAYRQLGTHVRGQ